MPEKLERLIGFRPAYDKRDPDPSKSYGVGSVTIRFAVRGKHGGVSFGILTGWYPSSYRPPKGYSGLMSSGIDYHSPIKKHDFQNGRPGCGSRKKAPRLLIPPPLLVQPPKPVFSS